jgi:2-keto-3-deoxy-L-rhamnonate aldolase RhmA
VETIDAIIDVNGITALSSGLNDWSCSLGVPGRRIIWYYRPGAAPA